MLKSIASARASFTRADIEFIESLYQSSQAIAICTLASDPDCLQELLDQPELRKALLESPVALPISPAMYFYVMVRQALLEGGVDHLELSDHIAGVLVDKLYGAARGSGSVPYWATHAVDYIALIRNASGLLQVHLEVAAGDQFLVLTALFPEFIQSRQERSGAPSLDFYASFGRQSYHRASNRSCLNAESRELLGLLAEVFPIAQGSLSRMRDHCMFLGN